MSYTSLDPVLLCSLYCIYSAIQCNTMQYTIKVRQSNCCTIAWYDESWFFWFRFGLVWLIFVLVLPFGMTKLTFRDLFTWVTRPVLIDFDVVWSNLLYCGWQVVLFQINRYCLFYRFLFVLNSMFKRIN